ncbi:BA75_03668T0 [Komagataella pastoris]|uniref:Glutaredoxin-like protein n=1 Tax=Komagataella pastoris TaxID=4922 RepID=A0A1B2JER7_PICPA|nr:BA75_03668T0 [Komagataella pastoris]
MFRLAKSASIVRPCFGLRTSRRLIQSQAALPKTSIKFFTKENCQLCDEAKLVLEDVLQDPQVMQRGVDLQYIDILANKKYFEMYRYDVPVIHIQREDMPIVKYMHRLDKQEIIGELID